MKERGKNRVGKNRKQSKGKEGKGRRQLYGSFMLFILEICTACNVAPVRTL